jgi:hypothetical protein
MSIHGNVLKRSEFLCSTISCARFSLQPTLLQEPAGEQGGAGQPGCERGGDGQPLAAAGRPFFSTLPAGQQAAGQQSGLRAAPCQGIHTLQAYQQLTFPGRKPAIVWFGSTTYYTRPWRDFRRIIQLK